MPKQETFQPILNQSDASFAVRAPVKRGNPLEFVETAAKLGMAAYGDYKEVEYEEGTKEEINKYIRRKHLEAFAQQSGNEDLNAVLQGGVLDTQDPAVQKDLARYQEFYEMSRQGAANSEELQARLSAHTIESIRKYPHLGDRFRKAHRAVVGDYSGMLNLWKSREDDAAIAASKLSMQQKANQGVVDEAIKNNRAIPLPNGAGVDIDATLKSELSRNEFSRSMDRIENGKKLGQINAMDGYLATSDALDQLLDQTVRINQQRFLDILNEAEASGDPNTHPQLVEVTTAIQQLSNSVDVANEKAYREALPRVPEKDRSTLTSTYEMNKGAVQRFREMFTDTKTGYGATRMKALQDMQTSFKMTALQAGGVLYSMREMLGDQVMANIINSNLLKSDISASLESRTQSAIYAALNIPAQHHGFMTQQLEILNKFKTLAKATPQERESQIGSIWNKVVAFTGSNKILPIDKKAAATTMQYMAQLGQISDYLTTEDSRRLIETASSPNFMDVLSASTKLAPELGEVANDEIRRGLILSYDKVQEGAFNAFTSFTNELDRMGRPGGQLRLEYDTASGIYTIRDAVGRDVLIEYGGLSSAAELKRNLKAMEDAANAVVKLKDSDDGLRQATPQQVKEYLARSFRRPVELVGPSTIEGVTPAITQEGGPRDSATLNSSLKEFAAHLRAQRAAVERIGTRAPADKQSSVAPQERAGYEEYAAKAALDKGLDPDLVAAVIDQESNWKPKAQPRDKNGELLSSATGLMQLIKKTAANYGVTDPNDPRQSIDGGTSYLRDLMAKYGDDPKKIVAAYYIGETDFDPIKNQPYHKWPEKVRAHVDAVMSFYNKRQKQNKNSNLSKLEPGMYVDTVTGETKDLRNPRRLVWGPDGALKYAD